MKLHSESYSKYKGCKGEWLPSIPFEWQELRVKDLFRLVTESAPANNDYELLSLYSSIGVRPRKDMEARGNKASSTDGYWIVKKNDIVVNKLLAWMGGVGLSVYDGVTSPAYDVLRQTKPDIDPRYFSYLFRTEIAKKIFRKNSRGIMDMRLRLYFDKLGAIIVPLPSLGEQQIISDYIDQKVRQIDSKVSLLEKKSAAYCRLKRVISDRTVLTGLNESVTKQFSKKTGITEVPSHWKVLRLKEIGFLYSGLTGKKGDDFTDEHLNSTPFIPFTNIAKNFLLSANELKSVVIHKGESQNEVKKNDLFFLMSSEDYNDIGRCSLLVDDLERTTYLNSFCKGFRIIKKDVNPKFLNYLLHTSIYRSNLSIEGKGFTRINLKMEKVNDIKLVLPPMDEQIEAVKFLDENINKIDRLINNIEKQIYKLKELRIAIVNDAVLGRIKIPVNNKG